MKKLINENKTFLRPLLFTLALSTALSGCGGGGGSSSNTAPDFGNWLGAEAIETDDLSSSYPKIAFASNGDAFAVWQNNADVYANIYDATGASWGTAQGIENTALGVTDLQLAVDPNGNAMAVWAHWTGAGSINDIRAAYYNGMNWEADVAIEANANDARYPQVAFDASGNATVVWLQSDGTAPSIYTNRYVPGGGWDGATLRESDAGEAFAPDIAADDGGDVIIVWTQDNQAGGGPYDAVYAAYYTSGGSWAEQGEIGEAVAAGVNASKVSIAQDGDGNAIAVWHQLDGASTSVWTNRYTGGVTNSWGNPATQLEASVNSSTQPQIAFDAFGNAMALWKTGGRVRAVEYGFNTGWDLTPDDVDAGIDNTGFPKLAVDLDGNAIAVWFEDSMTVQSIWANTYQPGTGWGDPELLETDDTNIALYPDVAVDSDGNAFAIWAQDDITTIPADQKIWVNMFEPN